MSISRWMDKKAVVHIHNGVLTAPTHHPEAWSLSPLETGLGANLSTRQTSQGVRHRSSRLGLVGYDHVPVPSSLSFLSPSSLSLSSCQHAMEGSCLNPSWERLKTLLPRNLWDSCKNSTLALRPFSGRRPKTEVNFPASELTEWCSNDRLPWGESCFLP